MQTVYERLSSGAFDTNEDNYKLKRDLIGKFAV